MNNKIFVIIVIICNFYSSLTGQKYSINKYKSKVKSNHKYDIYKKLTNNDFYKNSNPIKLMINNGQQSQWEMQNPHPTLNTLNAVSHIDALNAWAVGDSGASRKCTSATSMWWVFSDIQRGYFDIAALGGAQIDKYGNLNTTVITGDD